MIGTPQSQLVSMFRLSLFIWILNQPFSPQYSPHELRPIQYS